MKKKSVLPSLISVFFSLVLGLNSAFSQSYASVYSGDNILSFDCQVIDSIDGYVENPVNMELSKYGGWKARQVEATGFFRVEKIDGRWWAVDPEGYLYIHKAPNSIHLDDFTATEIYELLPMYGFNGMGNWSDPEIITDSDPTIRNSTPMSYCPKLSFMGAYTKEVGSDLVMPVFNDDFQDVCDELAQVFAPFVDDPHVFGYFSDNELPWRDQGLPAHIAITDHTDKNYISAINFLTARGKDATNWEQEDQYEYMAVMAERYYSVISSAIKKVDPNHMYIGSRCNSAEKTVEAFLTNAGKYVDIFSTNHYSRWGNRQVEIQRMSEWAGKPLMTTEFYAQVENPDIEETGAGFRVTDELSRGLFYQNFVSTMAESGFVVGMHWFAFQDKGDSHKCFIDKNGDPYPHVVDQAKRLNDRIYDFIDFVDSRPDPDYDLLPEADAFFQAGTNYGDSEELWSKEGNRETYIRFDLSSVTSNDIASAKIKLYSVAQRSETGSYQAELVVDNSWEEMGIKNSNNPPGSTILATWSDGDDQLIDVTSEVIDALGDDKKISIRIISTLNNGSIPRYGSRENSNPVSHPRLWITKSNEECTNLPITSPNNLLPGIQYTYYTGDWDLLPDFSSLTPNNTGILPAVSLSPATDEDYYGFTYDGLINIIADGDYTFYTSSDDGSRLYIDGELIVDNDGTHNTTEESGSLCLVAGYHYIRVEFFEKRQGNVLDVLYSGPDFDKMILSNLYTEPLPSKQDQTISFSILPNKEEDDANFSPGATASSGLPISYTSSNTNVAIIVNNEISVIGNGTTVITASQEGNGFFNPAEDVQQYLTVTVINSLEQNNLNERALLYPNPVIDVFTIERTNTDLAEMEIFNSIGTLVMSMTITEQQTEVNVKNLATGMYHTRITYDGFIVNYIIMKE